MTLLGGMGTVVGPAIGAGIVVTLQNELADKVGSMVTMIMGVIFIICVLVFRRGIVGEVAAWHARCKASGISAPASKPAGSTASSANWYLFN
jgi:branched-chain amino acid transport system permease protein